MARSCSPECPMVGNDAPVFRAGDGEITSPTADHSPTARTDTRRRTGECNGCRPRPTTAPVGPVGVGQDGTLGPLCRGHGKGRSRSALFSAKTLDTWAGIDIIMVGLGGTIHCCKLALVSFAFGQIGPLLCSGPAVLLRKRRGFFVCVKSGQYRTGVLPGCARAGRWDRNPYPMYSRPANVRGN